LKIKRATSSSKKPGRGEFDKKWRTAVPIIWRQKKKTAIDHAHRAHTSTVSFNPSHHLIDLLGWSIFIEEKKNNGSKATKTSETKSEVRITMFGVFSFRYLISLMICSGHITMDVELANFYSEVNTKILK
jgi:hypothetical protein